MVQPLDVSIKKPLKNYACEHFKQHGWKTQRKGKTCFDYKMGRQGMGTCKETKNLIEHSCKKCSLSNNFDGRQDALININRLRLEVVVYTLCIFNCTYWKKKSSYLTQERDHR